MVTATLTCVFKQCVAAEAVGPYGPEVYCSCTPGLSLEADDSQNNEITTKLTYIFVCIDDASKKVEHRFKMPMISNVTCKDT